MHCEQVHIDLASGALGGLNASDEAAVADHLRECVPCRTEYAGFVAVVRRLATVMPHELEPDGRPVPDPVPDPTGAIEAVRRERTEW
ncbi:hypothetical protein V1L54_18350 [Streptomyces sp. TRM 70361]|uniref:hypothetical protein n=1 Tax=Streptomyces sp. TRM 70361 TaxID=3116553 RepID=UPI002E7C4BE3|nr:hypothetical protein [Streptomyces sp. TRM 70361]MEE1941345.1 hypothetical protein [Streptomyces sp. TRM 70361]